MNDILAIGLQSMQADMSRVDQIGMNLTNALTPGFKRGVAVQGPIGGSFADQLAAAAQGPDAPVSPVQLRTDSRAGTLKATGQPLDVAIAGNGYFEVMTEAGPAYTRQGNFHVDARGRLVTAQGHPVMGLGGEISLNVPNPVITVAGELRSRTADPDAPPLAQLKVVEIEGESRATAADALLTTAAPTRPLSASQVQLRQGFLENSNVNSTTEMTSLVSTMRHFETMQKVIQGTDEMLATAIRKLGENP